MSDDRAVAVVVLLFVVAGVTWWLTVSLLVMLIIGSFAVGGAFRIFISPAEAGTTLKAIVIEWIGFALIFGGMIVGGLHYRDMFAVSAPIIAGGVMVLGPILQSFRKAR